MLSFVLGSLFHTAGAAPDATSQITCNMPNGIVNVRSTWGAVCKAAAREAGVSKVTDFSVFGIDVSGSNGNVINVNPASGTKDSFDFQISVKDATGLFEITNTLGVAPIQITVVDIPTNMTEMKCDSVLNVTSQVNCTLTPRDLTGAQIWAESKIFFMSGVDIGLATGGNIVWQSVTPAVGNYFTVLGTMPYSSVFGITNGVTSQLAQTAALDVPDNTTTMVCVPDVAVPEISPRCTITAKKAGFPIFTSYSAFTAGGVNRNAAFGAVRPVGSSFVDLGNVFSFDIVIGTSIQSEPFANTGVFPVSNGVSSDFLLTVVADPDSTARLTCESNQVVAGGPLHCTSTPRLQGTQIWSETALWVLSAVDILGQTGSTLGSFSSIIPLKSGPYEQLRHESNPLVHLKDFLVGNLFNWTFTPNAVVPNQTFPFDVTLNDGRSPIFVVKVVAPQLPDATSNMSCTPTTLPLGNSTTCTIYANRNGVAAVAAGNAFTRTDGGNGGTFSPLTPTAGKVFTFTYTPSVKVCVLSLLYDENDEKKSHFLRF